MLIVDPATDPAFNLAAEEYLLRERGETILRLWRNNACVVIGRHQIPCLEVNLPEAFRRRIPVLRRLSGGGTVYHDLGNLNFSFFGPVGGGIDFDRMMLPFVEALRLMGIDAVHAGRGDLRLNGSKISGNAAYLWRGRLLHHGTLLFKAGLDELEALLEVPGTESWKARSTRSVRSPVTNISDVCAQQFADIEAFIQGLSGALAQQFGEDLAQVRTFDDSERSWISGLAASKYGTREWNLGASPDYALNRRLEGQARLSLVVRKGKIVEAETEGLCPECGSRICNALKGAWHEPGAVSMALQTADAGPCPVTTEALF